MESLRDDDILIITADHGNDPTHIDFNHTREYVFCLMCGKSLYEAVGFACQLVVSAMHVTRLQPDYEVRGVSFETTLGQVAALLG